MRSIVFFLAFCAAALVGLPSIAFAQRGHGGHGSSGGSNGSHNGSSGTHMGSFAAGPNSAFQSGGFNNMGAHPSQLPSNINQGIHPSQLPANAQGLHSSQFSNGAWNGGWWHNGYYYPHGFYPYNPALYWTAFGLSLAAPLFRYPWGYSRYDYGTGAPYYQGSYYYGPPDGYAAAPQAPTDQPPPQTEPYHEATDPHAANVEVRLPANAMLWILGQKTTSTGDVRHFYSPPLAEGETYTYEFHARWIDASGHTVERIKNLDVHAGSWMGVDFNRQDH